MDTRKTSDLMPETYPAWLASGVSAAARAELKSHPLFPAVMAEAAAALTALYDGNRLLNRVLNDRGRVLFGFFALYLHALPEEKGGGLTVGRMTALSLETGVCSRGRAKAMLALMRWGGYLAPAAAPRDKRVRPLAPTPRMLALQRQRWRLQYEQISRLDPSVAAVPEALEDEAFFNRLCIAFGEGFRAGFRVLRHAPSITPIAERDNGLMVMLKLFTAQTAGEPAPAITQLSHAFHISRAHVLELAKAAEAAGLLTRGGAAGTGRLTAQGEAALGDFFASIFAFLASCARQALRPPENGA